MMQFKEGNAKDKSLNKEGREEKKENPCNFFVLFKPKSCSHREVES